MRSLLSTIKVCIFVLVQHCVYSIAVIWGAKIPKIVCWMCILCAVDGFKLFAEAHFINIAEIEDIMHNEKTKQQLFFHQTSGRQEKGKKCLWVCLEFRLLTHQWVWLVCIVWFIYLKFFFYFPFHISFRSAIVIGVLLQKHPYIFSCFFSMLPSVC